MTDIVFMHGGHHGSWCWRHVQDEMTARPATFSRALALDAPGCGTKRDRDTSSLTLDDTVAELNADVRAAGIRNAVLVGHSMAGIIVPRMVVAAPDLYDAVILLAVAAPREGETLIQMMGSSVHGENPREVGFPLDPATTPADELRVRMFCEDMDEPTRNWLLDQCAQDDWPAAIGNEPISREGFAGLKPVTYIITLRDGILPVMWQGRFAERFGTDTGIVTIDTPHEPFITHPRLLADTIEQIIVRQSNEIIPRARA